MFSVVLLCFSSSHLRTMTALLDPAQIEERERRRLKQLEQQVRGWGAGGERKGGIDFEYQKIVAVILPPVSSSEQSKPRWRSGGDRGSKNRRGGERRRRGKRGEWHWKERCWRDGTSWTHRGRRWRTHAHTHTHTQARSARFSTRLIFSTPSLNCFLSTSVLQEQLSHQAEQPHKDHDDDRHQEILEPSGEQSFCSVAAIQTKTHTVQKLAPRTWSRCFAPWDTWGKKNINTSGSLKLIFVRSWNGQELKGVHILMQHNNCTNCVCVCVCVSSSDKTGRVFGGGQQFSLHLQRHCSPDR